MSREAPFDCAPIETLIWRRLDGELGPAGADALARHLAACPDCRALEGELVETDAAIAEALPAELFGADLQDRILAALPTARSSEGPLRIAPGPVTAPVQDRPAPTRLAAVALFAAAAALLVSFVLRAPKAESLPRKAPLAAAAESGLSIEQIQGWRPLPAGAPVPPGRRLANRSTRPCKIRMPTGTEVTLRPDTVLTLERGEDGGLDLDLSSGEGGEVLCQVAKGHGAFRVHARDLTVTVLGTQFMVRSYQGLSRVVVLEGEVLCAYKDQRAALRRGQEAALRDQRLKVTRSRLEKRTHWLAPPNTSRRSLGGGRATPPRQLAPPQEPPPFLKQKPGQKPGEDGRGLDLPVSAPGQKGREKTAKDPGEER